ncbi:hypothetical protein ACTXT7_010610, partial [Hymenolepis weldensis]
MEFLKRIATEQACLENPNINLHIEEVKKGSQGYTVPDLSGHLGETQKDEGETVTATVTDNERTESQHTTDDENKSNYEESVPEIIESNVDNPIA